MTNVSIGDIVLFHTRREPWHDDDDFVMPDPELHTVPAIVTSVRKNGTFDLRVLDNGIPTMLPVRLYVRYSPVPQPETFSLKDGAR